MERWACRRKRNPGEKVTMKIGNLFAIFAITVCTVAPAGAYDGLDQDYATCTQGQGKVDADQVVQACTRLIDNSAKENELVGIFYAMRATASTDKKSNCRDARKILELVKDPTFVSGAKTLM